MALYSTFFSLFRTTDALTMANARIVSLEAELEASKKAWDVATAAKATTEKSAKSATTKAKKAEKALADTEQERAQREQAITKCLNQILALAGGKYRAILFLSACSFFDLLKFAHYPLSLSFVFPQRKLEYLWRRYSRMMKIL
jgi:septal ring factor EnvC (AmiA/AmiB activator)